MKKVDVCIIGSGAGGAPIGARLAKRGLSVHMLERGPHYTSKDFQKADELIACRRDKYQPGRYDGARQISYGNAPFRKCNHLWTGTCVGGGTVRMYGLYFRMRAEEFHPLRIWGAFPGATVCDWPLELAVLEPYYDDVEYEIGVSGAWRPPGEKKGRFPFGPLKENAMAARFDSAATQGAFSCFPTPRAVISSDMGRMRKGCCYTGLCGSYGCSHDSKSSTLVSYISDALLNDNFTLESGAYVYALEAQKDAVRHVCYFNRNGVAKKIRAELVIVAASAIETARLLLNSSSVRHPHGLANSSGQVGRNLTFRMPCEVTGTFSDTFADDHLRYSPHIQRSTADWYQLDDRGIPRQKGGVVSFLYAHPNPIERAMKLSYTNDGDRVWGKALVEKIRRWSADLHVISDAFVDFLPNTDTFVARSSTVKDSFGISGVKITYRPHRASLAASRNMAYKIAGVYKAMGASGARMSNSPFTAGECQAGTCRMGTDPSSSVVNPECRSHDLKNMYITDSSWFPTGISVPPVATIMANSLRVADCIHT